MTQDASSRGKPRVNVGTIGPAGSGKTTLLAAILKVQAQSNLAQATSPDDIDNSDAAFFEYETQSRHYIHADCDGGADAIKDLITNVAQMNGVILVVSVSDGAMQQTRQQVRLARQLGLGSIVVFLNKCDAFDDDTLNMFEMELRALLTKDTFDGDRVQVIRGAAQSALGGDAKAQASIGKLLGALDSSIAVPAGPAQPQSLTPHTKFESQTYVLKGEEGGQRSPITANDRPQLYIGSTDVMGTVKLPDGVMMVMPGDNVTLTFQLDTPVAIAEQLRFAIFEVDDDDDDDDGGKIIGVGVVTKILS